MPFGDCSRGLLPSLDSGRFEGQASKRVRGGFSVSSFELTCVTCGRGFPVDDGIADFAEGRYFDDHPDPNALSEDARRGMENENEGRLFRAPMAGFYALTAVRSFTWLAGTALNPYLVLEVQRAGSSDAGQG